MNNIAITPYIALHALQIQNVKRNVVKKVSINELNNQTHIIPEREVKQNLENTNTINTNIINTINDNNLFNEGEGTNINELKE